MGAEADTEQLLKAVRHLHATTPSLSDFAPWPEDLTWRDRPPVPCPAQSLIHSLPAETPLLSEILAVSDHVEWRRTYSPDEIGQDFLDRYGYFELFGPEGQYHSATLRAYVAFWDAGLHYGWHDHEPHEIYFSLSGSPEFHARGQPSVTIGPGEAQYHAPWKVHAMSTRAAPFLCLAFWKGKGLVGRAKMLS